MRFFLHTDGVHSKWAHENERQTECWTDCTDMDDGAFEALVIDRQGIRDRS